jgi:translation elongation factor EF-G
MNLEITTDKIYSGLIMNDISSSKRGTIKQMNVINSDYVINAECPLKELIGYSSQIR